MESDEARDALHAADRAAAAPYTDYPPTPRWYSPATGAWAAVLVALLFAPDDRSWLRAVGLLVVAAGIAAFTLWYRPYRGVWPSFRPPREIGVAMAWFLVVAVLAVVGIALLASRWYWIGVLVAFPAVTLGIWLYELAYRRAARRARERRR